MALQPATWRRTLSAVQFTAAVTHGGDWQVARCLEVEVASQGHTVEEALKNLREAIELYFEDEALPEGLEPPIIATVERKLGFVSLGRSTSMRRATEDEDMLAERFGR